MDRFKLIKETRGHVAGDAVLRGVAARMARAVRPYDAVGRYGGEEFLLLLPGCDDAMAMQSAERMRERIRRSPIAVGGAEMHVTISFGVTALPKGTSTDSERLIRVADAALYLAKTNGRDRSESVAFS